MALGHSDSDRIKTNCLPHSIEADIQHICDEKDSILFVIRVIAGRLWQPTANA